LTNDAQPDVIAQRIQNLGKDESAAFRLPRKKDSNGGAPFDLTPWLSASMFILFLYENTRTTESGEQQ
jgi:hypothetical protein